MVAGRREELEKGSTLALWEEEKNENEEGKSRKKIEGID